MQNAFWLLFFVILQLLLCAAVTTFSNYLIKKTEWKCLKLMCKCANTMRVNPYAFYCKILLAPGSPGLPSMPGGPGVPVAPAFPGGPGSPESPWTPI